ncbi:MAG TPA: sulfatase-like hydrolase/transferase, partial [Thermoanaerobaculia bacterium]|nr:sulfatase-like hydrolase/transferase [Thermoanaerobaculia bacterium]
MPLRRRSLVPLLLSALAAGLTAAAIPAATVRPNVVFILTDDQDLVLNSMSYMPQTRALLAQQGMTFTQDFVPLSLCCPSRSTILTGL